MEEYQALVPLVVERTQGAMGWVTVEMVTVGNTAVAMPGLDLHLSLIQKVNDNAECTIITVKGDVH